MARTQIQILLQGIDQASANVNAVNAEVAALGKAAATANAQAALLGQNLVATGASATKAAAATENLAKNVTQMRAGFGALRGVMTVVGLQAFPQLTGAMLVASSTMDGLKVSAAAAGTTMGGMLLQVAPLAAGAVAVLATAREAMRAFEAADQARTAEQDMLAQQTDAANSMIKQLQRAGKSGFISANEAERLMLNLIGSAGNADSMRRALKESGEVIRSMNSEGLRLVSAEEFKEFMKIGQEGLLDPPARAMAELNRQMDEFVVKGGKLAAAAGASEKEVFDLAHALVEKGKADIQAQQNRDVLQSLEVRRNAELSSIEQVSDLRTRMRLETLAGLETEMAAIDARYDRELDRMKSLKLSPEEDSQVRGEIEVARFTALERAKTKAEEEEAAKRKAIRIAAAESAASILGSMADAAKLAGERGFAVWKGIALAQAIVSTAVAISRGLAEGGAYAGPFLAAAAAAAGAVQIATIASTKPSGYAEGGYTGPGGKYEPAGIVHRGEFVFSQADVARIGLAPLMGLRLGEVGVSNISSFNGPFPGYAGGGLVTSPAGSSLTLAMISDRQDRREWESRKAMKVLVSDLRKRGAKIPL